MVPAVATGHVQKGLAGALLRAWARGVSTDAVVGRDLRSHSSDSRQAPPDTSWPTRSSDTAELLHRRGRPTGTGDCAVRSPGCSEPSPLLVRPARQGFPAGPA